MNHIIMSVNYDTQAILRRFINFGVILAMLASNFGGLVTPVQASPPSGVPVDVVLTESTPTPTPSSTTTASGPFFISVSVGSSYTCAIKTNSAAQCWGDNSNNQLGDGTTTQGTTPVDVSGLSNGVMTVAAGQSHSCAITDSGAVQCWGNNGSGQLGDGTTIQRTTPVSVSGLSSGATTLGLGSLHTCALVNGGVQCWGSNGNQQLGGMGRQHPAASQWMSAACKMG